MSDTITNARPIIKSRIEVVNEVGDLITIDDAKRLVDYAVDQSLSVDKTPTITFLGEHVIENFDSFLKPIIEHIKSFGCRYSVYVESSGVDLIDEQLAFMRRSSVQPVIKIDWALSDGHITDEFIAGVENIVAYFPSVSADFKLTPKTAGNLSNVVSILKELGIYYYKVSPDYFVEWSELDIEILESQIELIKKSTIDIFEDDDIPALFDDFAFMFRKIVAIIGEKQSCAEYRSIPMAMPCNRCGMGINGQMLIASNGDFHSCLRCKNEEFIVGNINEGVFNDKLVTLLNEVNSCVAIGIDCENCNLNRICDGGCVVANFAVNCDVNKASIIYCRWMQMLHRAASDIIEHFDATQSNDLFRDYFYGMVKRGGYYGC